MIYNQFNQGLFIANIIEFLETGSMLTYLHLNFELVCGIDKL